MTCPRCRQEYPSGANFCMKCGTPVSGLGVLAKPGAVATGELDTLRASLDEALEQQAATSEILRVI